jgi:dipeptidyl aminopeptidase/acylaminoacyl peptidase
VDNICTPLLIIQGANDPRVLPAESEQIVDRLRGLGREVEYTVFDDEGHAFLKRENELRAQRATADWFERHLRP